MFSGKRLKELRGKKYSQEKFAEILQVSNNTISRWENDIQEPRIKIVSEMAKILNTSSAYLMGETDNPKPNPLPDVLPPVASLNNDGKSAETYKIISYWSEFIGNIQEIARRGNLEEINATENFLNTASSLLAMGRTQARTLKQQMPTVDMSHWNNNNLTGSSVYAGNTVTQA